VALHQRPPKLGKRVGNPLLVVRGFEFQPVTKRHDFTAFSIPPLFQLAPVGTGLVPASRANELNATQLR
jgi:hypothetical protein